MSINITPFRAISHDTSLIDMYGVLLVMIVEEFYRGIRVFFYMIA